MLAIILIEFIGIIFVILGYLLWKKQKISLLHSYHYDKVSNENKRAFCTLSGIGVLLIGIGLMTTGVILGITDSAWCFIPFAISFVIGLIMLAYAGIKYNR